MSSADRDVDLTEGSIGGHFRALAIPAAIGMVFSTLYNVVDIWFAGLISTEAQAGLAIGFQAFFITMAVGFGLGSAMGALVGNARGRRESAEARALAAQGISYGAIASLILMFAAVWFGPLLISLVSEPGGYRDAGTQYFKWLIFALPGFLLAYGGNGILQARGNSVTLQRGLIAAFFANIILNPILIYGVPGIWNGMGFNGIALSTVLSQTGVMIYVLSRIFGRDMMQGLRRSEFMPDAVKFKEITAQMLPTSFAIVVMFAGGFVVQFALKDFGEHALAAYGIALRVEQILLLPVLGMTGALLPIAAQNFGAGHADRVRDAVFFCWKLGFLLMAIACPMLWFGGGFAMSLFTDNAEVIRVGQSYLRVDGFILPIYMMLFAINSLLQALKRPIWTLWIGIYRQGFGVAFFIWIYVGILNFSVWGVWFGIATSVLTGWILAMIVAERVARLEIGGLWVAKVGSK
ncbi:MATE family efflux transporter [Halocynthiibacter namhaensis]|uniref:MATE family efflux transporter n=1 Tax=Halocynthiibacter namhaensis TaxID=1290553 RepID=UPI0005790FBF|nr:MATE family efflux transporter [Halocynthiibacter namhaensis]